jgi:hypothetical protein
LRVSIDLEWMKLSGDMEETLQDQLEVRMQKADSSRKTRDGAEYLASLGMTSILSG